MDRTPVIRFLRAAAIVGATAALVACSNFENGDDGGDPAAGGGGTVSIEAGDLYFDPEEASAAAGTVTFEFDNVGDAEHALVIDEADDTEVARAAGGETATGTLDLDPGTYTYYCSVPGHRSAMEGTLEIT